MSDDQAIQHYLALMGSDNLVARQVAEKLLNLSHMEDETRKRRILKQLRLVLEQQVKRRSA